MPHIEREQGKEDIIFEKLDRWIWSLRHDQPPTMEDVKPKLAMEALARIYGASQKGLPTIEFPQKFESRLRKIASLQAENVELKSAIKKNEEAIKAHSVRVAELMKNHEHGILTTTTDKLLVDFVTEVTKRVSSDYLKKRTSGHLSRGAESIKEPQGQGDHPACMTMGRAGCAYV